VADPRDVAEFDIAHHPERRAHEVYALAHAGAGSLDRALEYVPALETARPDLPLRVALARVLQRRGQPAEGARLLRPAAFDPRVPKNDPALPGAIVRAAELECAAGDCARARETLAAGRRLLPGNAVLEEAARKLRP
jgi:predicted Zn-dependent protease